jgi:DNA-binding LacI/PurR family transcriptional regulator
VLNRSVPGDISVIGFDDIKNAAFSVPALTTLRQQVGELGQMGIDQMILQIAGERPTGLITIQPQLVIRESCAPPRRTAV